MKTAMEWKAEWKKRFDALGDVNNFEQNEACFYQLIVDIQAEAFKAGQEATMKWVGEECRRQTERLIGFQ